MTSLAGAFLVATFVCFQSIAGPLYDIYGIRPDFVILAVVSVCLSLPPLACYITAILAGGLLDALSPGVAGPHIAGCLLSAFILVRCRRAGLGDTHWGVACLAITGILAGLMAPCGTRWALDSSPQPPWMLIGGTVAYTAVFALPFYRVISPIIQWSLPTQRGLGAITGRSAWQGRA